MPCQAGDKKIFPSLAKARPNGKGVFLFILSKEGYQQLMLKEYQILIKFYPLPVFNYSFPTYPNARSIGIVTSKGHQRQVWDSSQRPITRRVYFMLVCSSSHEQHEVVISMEKREATEIVFFLGRYFDLLVYFTQTGAYTALFSSSPFD